MFFAETENGEEQGADGKGDSTRRFVAHAAEVDRRRHEERRPVSLNVSLSSLVARCLTGYLSLMRATGSVKGGEPIRRMRSRGGGRMADVSETVRLALPQGCLGS